MTLLGFAAPVPSGCPNMVADFEAARRCFGCRRPVVRTPPFLRRQKESIFGIGMISRDRNKQQTNKVSSNTDGSLAVQFATVEVERTRNQKKHPEKRCDLGLDRPKLLRTTDRVSTIFGILITNDNDTGIGKFPVPLAER